MSTVGFQQPAPGPLGHAAAVTPSDTDPLPVVASSLYIGVTGDVTLVPAGQTDAVLFKAAPVGLLRVAASQVKSAGTTATDIVALW
jgi:hypothetical protein